MDIQTIKQNILESDEFVLSEMKRIQYIYTLKQTIRYGLDRHEDYETESVAEHVFAMHCLIDYFAPLEGITDINQLSKIHNFAQYHDIDEIETGDMIGYLKTDADRAREAAAAERVIAKFPAHLQSAVHEYLEEYEAQETLEARFTKAIDRIEPTFHVSTEEGRQVIAKNETTREQSDRIKIPYLKEFPTLLRFNEVLTNHMEKEGFFNHTGATL